MQMVQTIEPNASPSAFKKRLNRITRPQHTGIQTFGDLSAPIEVTTAQVGRVYNGTASFRESGFFWTAAEDAETEI